MQKITDLPEWRALTTHHQQIAKHDMRDWFANDATRFAKMSLQVNEILLDYSKNRLTPETLTLLCKLAEASQLSQKIEAYFTGQAINTTEKRPVLHTALRNRSSEAVWVDGENIMPLIADNLEKMRQFTDAVRQETWLGCTGKPIRDVVNVGIGGSHLGPFSAVHALAEYTHPSIRCHFISNVDTAQIRDILQKVNPETTLFIVSSKTFTTIETLTNANTIKAWLQDHLANKGFEKHFAAVTTATEKAVQFGVPREQIFPMWNWVGGRYSIWSAIGLPLALAIGMDQFLEFLRGAHEMDQHFRHADVSENMPVILGLLGIWYINFFDAPTQAIIPYSHPLTHFRAYLQQADMESNGKRISQQGAPVEYATGPIIWGEPGCDSQHSFHQLLHQSNHLTPVDFILVGNQKNDLAHHQDVLIGSGLSQAQALLQGKSYQQALSELLDEGVKEDEAKQLAHHKVIPGNRPSNILFLQSLTPYNLGALIALYEHKIFVQGAIWDINSFDQWGVELGKQLLPKILADLKNPQNQTVYDASTQGLIHHYKKLRKPS